MPSESELTLFYHLTAHKYRRKNVWAAHEWGEVGGLTSEAKWAVVSVTEKPCRLT